ncbi:hypothetical protein IL306_001568 [Fusarium sp. DS 682]|nr:hypothetical protein IL306_001568 [Fusarium sp. DS 682]
MASNHLSHALLVKLLFPLLQRASLEPSSAVCVVSVSSRGHVSVDKKTGLELFSAKTLGEHLGSSGPTAATSRASWLMIYPELDFVAVHPGLMQTDLVSNSSGTNPFIRTMVNGSYKMLATVEAGVRNQLWAATSPNVVSGQYYEPVGVPGKASDFGKNNKLAKELGEWTNEQPSGVTL